MPNKPGPKHPHGLPHVVQGTLRQKAWRAMQIKGKFTLSDLVRNALAEDSTARDPRNNLGRYVKALTKAGVLVEMPRRAAPASLTSNGEKRWMLMRDLGRLAPVARMHGGVYDPNSEKTFGFCAKEGGSEQ
jgi:hypothetical protein